MDVCNFLETEIFFTGFFCNNPIVDFFADEKCDIQDLTSKEKVDLFIKRGIILCQLTEKEPGFVVGPRW